MLKSRKIIVDSFNNQQSKHEGQLSFTHGFVPCTAIPQEMPNGYKILDELAKRLPEALKTLQERELIKQKLENLNLDMSELPDEYLARASIILNSLAHAYYFNQRECPIAERSIKDPLPSYILKPWKQVTDRIGRPDAIRNNYDTFLCNWYKTEGNTDIPQSLDDVELLVPIFNNNEEKIFNLTIMMMELKFAPVISAIVTALEAVQANDENKLIGELNKIKEGIEEITETFGNINVNRYHKHYVDQTIWVKTVGRFDGPIRTNSKGEEVPGVSGASSPLFHVLDAFIERNANLTELGEQINLKQGWMPNQHRNFIRAIADDTKEVKLKDFIEHSSNPLLKNTYQAVLDAYVGKHGLLDNHKLKVFGFMELNFKAGRKKTNGGHEGKATRQAAPHLTLNKLFFAANQERLLGHVIKCPFASKASQRKVTEQANEIILDISNTGLSFKPGERCAILPKNSSELIQKTLQALGATGNEEITLDQTWQNYLFTNYQISSNTIRLADFLKFAHIRPIDHILGKTLYELTNSPELLTQLHQEKTGGYALWEILNILKQKQFKNRIFSLESNQATSSNYISNVLKPLQNRLYSVSPIYDKAGLNKNKIRLTVGTHSYNDEDITQYGVASRYLATISNDETVIIHKVPAPNFTLPINSDTPILMFAAGTGIAPFIGFIEKRFQQQAKGENWLFLSITDEKNFPYKEELEKFVANNKLRVSIIFSRSDQTAHFNLETKKFEFTKKNNNSEKHIDAIIQAHAKEIADLILYKKASIYVCGQKGFEDTVENSLLTVMNKDKLFLYKLEANKRYHHDIFTPFTYKKTEYKKISEIAASNNDSTCWSIINGKAYNLSEFIHHHPGGIKIIRVSAGIDASDDYNEVGHILDPQIESQLAAYYIGEINYPKLNEENRLLFKEWVEFLYSVIEMKNNLINNSSFDTKPPIYLLNDIYDTFINGSFFNTYHIQVPNIYRKIRKKESFGKEMDKSKDLSNNNNSEKKTSDEIFFSNFNTITTEDECIYNLSKKIKDDSIKRLSLLENASQNQTVINNIVELYKILNDETIKFLNALIEKINIGVKEFENKEDGLSTTVLLAILNEIINLKHCYFKKLIAIESSYDKKQKLTIMLNQVEKIEQKQSRNSNENTTDKIRSELLNATSTNDLYKKSAPLKSSITFFKKKPIRILPKHQYRYNNPRSH